MTEKTRLEFKQWNELEETFLAALRMVIKIDVLKKNGISF
jgi:hypothetical protein